MLLITTNCLYHLFHCTLQQAVLILQLQKQHYEQYMQQVYQQQLLLQQQQLNPDVDTTEIVKVISILFFILSDSPINNY